jgi:hypothetical protein
LVVLLPKTVLRVVTLQKHVQNYVQNVKNYLLSAKKKLRTETKLVAYVIVAVVPKSLRSCVKSMAAKELALNLVPVQSVFVLAKKNVMKLAAVLAQVAVALKAVVLRVGLLVLLIQLLQIAVVVPVQAAM